MSKTATTFTWAEIKERKEQGELFIVFDSKYVYNLTKFAKHHPGGELVIKHAAATDATDAIIAFHTPGTMEKRMKIYLAGVLAPSEVRPTSPVSLSYRAMEKKLIQDGVYKTNLMFYFVELVKIVVLWLFMMYLVLYGPKTWLNYTISALTMAVLWHQSAFVGHDAGHNGITHIRKVDKAIGTFVGSFVGGLSIAWWKDSHNVHHLVTNEPEHDPDIQLMPFFAITSKMVNNLYSTYYGEVLQFDAAAKFLIPLQHYLYYIILSFGRFNLYALGIYHVFIHRREFDDYAQEIIGLSGYWIWYLTLMSYLPSWYHVIFFTLVANMTTMLLHVQITISHYAMSTERDVKLSSEGVPIVFEEEEEYATRALRTTMDVECPEWLDWLHGGLQYQVIHHLFPRVPRHNLRSLIPMVRQFAKEHGLTYHMHGFIKSNTIVLGALRDVGEQVKFLTMASIAKAKEMTGETKHHHH